MRGRATEVCSTRKIAKAWGARRRPDGFTHILKEDGPLGKGGAGEHPASCSGGGGAG